MTRVRWWIASLTLVQLVACDRVFDFEHPCDTSLGGACATCGTLGATCCAGEASCGDGLYCGADTTCSECVTDVTLGRRHVCAIRYDGTVWCSGQGTSAQLGMASMDKAVGEPVQLLDKSGAPFGPALSLGSGRDHTCAIKADHTLWCWGSGDAGRLGDNKGTGELEPAPVQVLQVTNAPLTDVVAVTAGDCYTCALDGSAKAWCWGCNVNGQLGDGTLTNAQGAVPVRFSALQTSGVAEISAGPTQACARTRANEAWCWGDNRHGQVGDGTSDIFALTAPTRVITFGVASISAGADHSCATMLDGTTLCWGSSARDHLGNGVDDVHLPQPSPMPVVESAGGPPLRGAVRVATGTMGCVMTAASELLCWGKDQYGSTGTGGGAPTPTHVLAPDGGPLGGVDRISVDYAHACAHLVDGRYVCWGRNLQGELANGTYVHTGRAATYQLTCP